jgi:t-SNARE complex subunit (syntaxin)
VQQEAQHIRMQQAQLISHQVRTQTQHPLEQQMMEITALLSQFTQILTQQQDDVLYIHDSAKLSLDHLKAGKEQIQEAAQHKRKRNHALRHLFAWIIFTLACTLLFFHWILP